MQMCASKLLPLRVRQFSVSAGLNKTASPRRAVLLQLRGGWYGSERAGSDLGHLHL